MQNDECIVHFLKWFPLRVGRPNRGPKPPLGIELNLNRICKLRKFGFIRKQAYTKPFCDCHVLYSFFAANVFEASFFHCAGAFTSTTYIRYDFNRLGYIGVVRQRCLAASGSPHAHIAIHRHDIEH